MKKVYMIIAFLLLLYLVLMFGYRFYGKGHDYTYNISNEYDFVVKEVFNNDKVNPSYYFQIKVDNNDFYFQTYEKFNNKSKIIKTIYYYSSDLYKCIFPIFDDNRIITDILCKKTDNNYFYYYRSLKGLNKELDEFVQNIVQYGYDEKQWISSDEKEDFEEISLYYDNIHSNNYVMLTNYKGIYILDEKNKKINKINLFSTDVYHKKIDYIYKNKYIVADYNQKFRFHEFYVIDIITGNKKKLVSNNEISFDSYIQGIVDNKIYLFDKDLKKQYLIDLDNFVIKEIGNEKTGIRIYSYEKLEWETVSAITASNQEILFTSDKKDTNKFTKIDFFGTEEFGYNFYYKQVDDRYLVYRSNSQYSNQLTYVFTTSNINNVIYFYDSVYFIDGNFICNYSDKYGVKEIIEYKELGFNDNLRFSVYK